MANDPLTVDDLIDLLMTFPQVNENCLIRRNGSKYPNNIDIFDSNGKFIAWVDLKTKTICKDNKSENIRTLKKIKAGKYAKKK